MEAVGNSSSNQALIEAVTRQNVREQSGSKAASQAAAEQVAPTSIISGKEADTSKTNATQVSISEEAKQAGVSKESNATQVVQQPSANSNDSDPGQLTEEERKEVERLKARDREVRAHEQAHVSALGAYKTGGPSYTYETGPDGNQYAVGGEVPVDVSEAETPEKTIQKAQTIRRAALAPAEPSGADRAVAAQASQLESRARAELAEERSEEIQDGESTSPVTPPATSEEESSVSEAGEEQREALAPETNDITSQLIGKFQTPKTCPVCGGDDDGHSHQTAVA